MAISLKDYIKRDAEGNGLYTSDPKRSSAESFCNGMREIGRSLKESDPVNSEKLIRFSEALSSLTELPEDMQEDDYHRYIQTMEEFRDYLQKPVNGKTGYDIILEAGLKEKVFFNETELDAKLTLYDEVFEIGFNVPKMTTQRMKMKGVKEVQAFKADPNTKTAAYFANLYDPVRPLDYENDTRSVTELRDCLSDSISKANGDRDLKLKLEQLKKSFDSLISSTKEAGENELTDFEKRRNVFEAAGHAKDFKETFESLKKDHPEVAENLTGRSSLLAKWDELPDAESKSKLNSLFDAKSKLVQSEVEELKDPMKLIGFKKEDSPEKTAQKLIEQYKDEGSVPMLDETINRLQEQRDNRKIPPRQDYIWNNLTNSFKSLNTALANAVEDDSPEKINAVASKISSLTNSLKDFPEKYSALQDPYKEACGDFIKSWNGMVRTEIEADAYGLEEDIIEEPEEDLLIPAEDEVPAGEAEVPDEQEHVDLINDDLGRFENSKSAASYIERIRDEGFRQKDPELLTPEQKDLYLDRFVRIMASRELSDSIRNKSGRLVSTTLDQQTVDRRAAEMKNDPTFRKFFKTLRDDPKQMKEAIDAAAKRPGHGGGLDDMFKKFVKNQPASTMRNDGILKRYMPTVKERLEILQEQHKAYTAALKESSAVTNKLNALEGSNDINAKRKLQAQKTKLQNTIKNYASANVAAEMIALRNIAQADKGKKASLEKPIPVADGKDVLMADSQTLISKKDSRDILETNAVRELIRVGHGGNMMAEARSMANNVLDRNADAKELEVFNKNTIGARLRALEGKAEGVYNGLDAAIKEGAPAEQHMKNGKLVLAEYMLLDGKSRDPKTDGIDENLLNQDVPWTEIDTMKRKGPEKNQVFNSLTKNMDPESMKNTMGNLKAGDQNEFIASFANRKNMIDKLPGENGQVNAGAVKEGEGIQEELPGGQQIGG